MRLMARDFRIPYALVLTVRDVDPDYLLVEVLAGSAEVYEGVDLATSLAAQLAGFPRAPSDQRDFVLGSFDPRCQPTFEIPYCSTFQTPYHHPWRSVWRTWQRDWQDPVEG
jgi:hypothetical protein